jgi:hypothetical protein
MFHLNFKNVLKTTTLGFGDASGQFPDVQIGQVQKQANQ